MGFTNVSGYFLNFVDFIFIWTNIYEDNIFTKFEIQIQLKISLTHLIEHLEALISIRQKSLLCNSVLQPT